MIIQPILHTKKAECYELVAIAFRFFGLDYLISFLYTKQTSVNYFIIFKFWLQ